LSWLNPQRDRVPWEELRDLTRTRKQLMREVVQHKQRIQKVLEDANVKLASVVSDVFGQSGRRMLKALIAGQTDARKLAALGSEQLSASRETLAQALHGKVTTHHRFLLKQHLQMIEHLEQTVSEFEAQIEAALEPFRAAVERLMTIPGVSATAAAVIIAEIGVDMSRCVRNSTRVPARSCRAGCATGPRGSKPYWCSAPGRPPATSTTIYTPSS